MRRRRIGVVPASVRRSHARLFDALELSLDVEFVGVGADGLGTVDGIVAAGDGAADAPVPTLRFASADNAPGAVSAVVDLDGDELGPPLRGHSIADDTIAPDPAGPALPHVMARVDRRAVWTAGGDRVRSHRVACTLPEPQPTDTLRDHFRPGRFLAVAALIAFCREILGATAWQPPPLRASFI